MTKYDELERQIESRRALGFSDTGVDLKTLDELLANLGQPQVTDAQIDNAAQTIAASFDYPWKEMPEEGKGNMRDIARKVLSAPQEQAPADKTVLSGDLFAQINSVHGELYKRRETVDFLRGVDAMSLSLIERLQSQPQQVTDGEDK